MMEEQGSRADAHREAQEILAEMRQAVARGEKHWFLALLEAVRRWPLPEERIGDRVYRYLIGGEAFDWLLLAERLCDELAGLIPEDECEDLLFHGCLPLEQTEEEMRRLMGPAKYRAHLNFFYGVLVEEALQLAVQEEVHKERLSRIWENGYVDDEVYQRIYGARRQDLVASFRKVRRLPDDGPLSMSEWHEFTYWLFKHRVRIADPARVASDTRKGLAMLAKLEALRPPRPARPAQVAARQRMA